jgi:hypothetical protein
MHTSLPLSEPNLPLRSLSMAWRPSTSWSDLDTGAVELAREGSGIDAEFDRHGPEGLARSSCSTALAWSVILRRLGRRGTPRWSRCVGGRW